eukprot:gene5918-6516_t
MRCRPAAALVGRVLRDGESDDERARKQLLAPVSALFAALLAWMLATRRLPLAATEGALAAAAAIAMQIDVATAAIPALT